LSAGNKISLKSGWSSSGVGWVGINKYKWIT
jgi:hypothetical protein